MIYGGKKENRVSKQIRVSDKYFEDLSVLASDLGVRKSELIGVSIGILKSLRSQKSKVLKVVRDDGSEIEVILGVDLSV